MSRFSNLGHRLYVGDVSFDFVGRRKLWLIISGIILLAAVVGLGTRGLNLGIEFKGGDVYQINQSNVTVSQAQSVANSITGDDSAVVQSVTTEGSGKEITVQINAATKIAVQPGKTEVTTVTDKLAAGLGVDPTKISTQSIGASWGKEISQKALEGLIVFLVLVTLYLAFAFEWRLAIAALTALMHDMLITVGIYALLGFTVSSGTVIGFLTILGYSLYDTVVVFDGLKDATRKLDSQSRETYSEAANRALNGTLVRSINTTVLALLPVAGLLFIGGAMLGAGTLNDISLALFVGLSAGAYSSICVATPMVAWLKEKQPENRELAKRVAKRRAAEAKALAEGRVPEAQDGSGDALGDAEGRGDAVGAGSGTGGTRRQPVNRTRSDRRSTGKRN
ncbi:protein translocase subunit SecF [Streptacidiphilus sp. PB12-B1b]|uniref:protein translocase subunit SecF n=1 Tax=Streptacidiphilus sp. PB12-B1b TaxID=2705012 RepID=UPI0015FABAC2|nr:protein translocase subunit SecF [Streptacidiphilus sp. PB12-B1b]QMU76402.1 protein translocase subunit SecF [Streptacidiphilus sp. PB12-B1b]